MNPLLRALIDLGGSGSIYEISDRVASNLKLPEDVLAVLHPGKNNTTEVEYRLAWTRTYLKKYGVIEQSSRGIWAIVSDQRHIVEVDPKEVVRTVRDRDRKVGSPTAEPASKLPDEPEGDETATWKGQLHSILTEVLDPSGFERLIQRVLRESGFVQVEVTGRTGDGGIDGKGIARIHGLLSFHVLFQCKRYKGTVGSSEIRDFRGAMVGRADKGLFVTTGTFTRDALREAIRDGAPPIDLVDGEQLANKLKELSLGVRIQRVERIVVEREWFKNI